MSTNYLRIFSCTDYNVGLSITGQMNSVEKQPKPAGRRKTDNPRNYRLALLFTKDEFYALLTRADPQRLTDYARQVLLDSLPTP